ncbi:p21-activated protein kinase-interacting protein 1-like [Polypterus senegalus]|uniref:p21-activated protein kinase-interacting protein 1-like n=1 Tax=Polypterus senegalus TaxID=55291 RepID=UPI0019639B33|nr:p21-activated protein kinase-interacting protein 1-like [Polypterus senegalus]
MAGEVLLVAGCYEQVALGFRVQTTEETWNPVPDFTHHAHTASVSAVAVNERYIATGSRDESIQLYDMKKRVDHGALLHHDGTITCLEFYGSTHLLSGGEDGLICVWNTKKWECLKTIKAHVGHVTSLAVHPSGKLALSVGTDKTLRTWNLINGRSAFIKNIKQTSHIVMWCPKGEKYVVVVNDKIHIYNLETASISGTISHPKRVLAVKFVTDSVLAAAGDEETVRLYDIKSLQTLCEFKAHENRVKALCGFALHESNILVTASSDGFIKMWRVNPKKFQECPTLLGEINTTARLTCLAVWKPSLMDSVETKKTEATCSEGVEESLPQPKKLRKVTEQPSEEVLVEVGAEKKRKKKLRFK